MRRFLIIFAFLYSFPALVLCLLLLFTCEEKIYDYDKSKPTEFFKAEEGWSDEARRHKYENFVISNPPNDSSLLRKMVEEYNLQTIPLDTIKKHSSYEREFYRESMCLPHDYKENKPCGQQDFRDHRWIIITHYYPFFEGDYIDYIDYAYIFDRKTFGDTTSFKIIKIENDARNGKKTILQ